MRDVKDLIQTELPKAGFVDGPWKIYTERLKLVDADVISKDAFEHIKAEIFKVSDVELSNQQISSLMGVRAV